MRYKRLKQEVTQRDQNFAGKIMRNYFVCIRKVGTLWKKSEGFFGNWQQRFVVLSNAGLIYFKVDKMKREDDLQPQNFKPLHDFVLVEVPESVSQPPTVALADKETFYLSLCDPFVLFIGNRSLAGSTRSESFFVSRQLSRRRC